MNERLDIFSTIVLSIATLAIAWCSYQSSLWNGIQTISLIEANTTDMDALEKTTLIKQQQEIDATAVLNFANAVIDDRKERIEFYLRHGRPQMTRIFADWLKTDPVHNPNAPLHPMVMKEYVQMIADSTAVVMKLKEQAVKLKDKGLQANLYSDNYVLFTVLFSLVLFINGVSSKASNPRVMRILFFASAIVCLLGLITMFSTLPITRPG